MALTPRHARLHSGKVGTGLGAEQMVEKLTDRNLEPEENVEQMSMTAIVSLTLSMEHELREGGLELCGTGEGGREERRKERERESNGWGERKIWCMRNWRDQSICFPVVV